MSSRQSANPGQKSLPYYRELDAFILLGNLNNLARRNGFSDEEADVCARAAAAPCLLIPAPIRIERKEFVNPKFQEFWDRYRRVQGAKPKAFAAFIPQARRICERIYEPDPRADQWHVRVLNLVGVEMIDERPRIHPMSYDTRLRRWELARRRREKYGSPGKYCVPGIAENAKFALTEELTDNHRVALVKEMKGECSNDIIRDEKSRAAIAKLRLRLARRQGAGLRRHVQLPFDVKMVPDTELPMRLQQQIDCAWLIDLLYLETEILEQNFEELGLRPDRHIVAALRARASLLQLELEQMPAAVC